MKKLIALALILFGTQCVQAQFFKNNFYYEGEVGGISSFFVEDSEGKTHVFTVGGLSFRGGVGVHDEDDIIYIGLYSGVEGNFRWRTGICPVYVNTRVGIPIVDETQVYIAFGYGKSFQVGPENLNGFLRKYTIGLSGKSEDGNRQSFFLEINNHGFNFPNSEELSAITLNFGFSFTFQ